MEESEMRKFRILALVLALLVILPAVVACKKTGDDGNDTGDNTKEVVYQPVDPADAVEHKDYTSVYDMIGAKVTIDMVTENDDGTAKVTYEGKDYELGMDFLSMAMVYNTTVPAGSTKYKTAEDVYNEWWKLYIQRWNLLVPEVPLYSNQYFDIYNANRKLQDHSLLGSRGCYHSFQGQSRRDQLGHPRQHHRPLRCVPQRKLGQILSRIVRP